jgi:Secretion system C-terminal sorting domain
MKKSLLILTVLLLCVSITNAQRAKIETKAVTPGMLASNSAFTQDSTIASGLRNVANKTWCYVNVRNISGTATITGATWTILTKPSGSNANISSIPSIQWWARFRPDVKGEYVVKVTMNTSAGSHDTTTKIYAADFVGVGRFGGIAAQYPNCMSCHGATPSFVNIYNKWEQTGHANMFRFNIDSGSASYGLNCFPCHTVGYNHNLKVDNHGFDDVAAVLGWVWQGPPHAGKWDSLKTMFPSLVAFATIGCENCHGPGSEHAASGDTNRISISYDANMCGQCHDSPTHHIKNYQFNQSAHSQAVWSNSFAQNSGAPGFNFNGLGNCIRCHDAKGYANFSKGIGTNTVGMIEASHDFITCQACHDPHGGPNEYQLRTRPVNSDTLANGYHYAGGLGKVCLDCHKNRTDNTVTVQTRVTNSHWGPHHSPQGDILFGQNTATFGGPPYISGSHRNIANVCVQCHMAPTADTGTASLNKVGEHTFKMVDEQNNYENVKGCLGCHPGVTDFEDFMAPEDYDGNNVIEDWQTEIEGCLRNLRIALPPAGIDSVSWQLIAADSNDVKLRKEYWNYLMLEYDGSKGMHNPFYYVSVYQATMQSILIGVQPLGNEIPTVYSLSQNYPNPFNPSTKINFSLPKQGNVTITIYDIMGREVYTLVNKNMKPGKYQTIWTSINNDGKTVASGLYFYRIEAGNFVESKKMILVR